jgi:hypothetical protein
MKGLVTRGEIKDICWLSGAGRQEVGFNILRATRSILAQSVRVSNLPFCWKGLRNIGANRGTVKVYDLEERR